MASQPFDGDHLPVPDEATFNREPMRAWAWRAIQRNAMHLHGTRVRQLVADIDIWRLITTTFISDLVYHVTLSEGVSVLAGTLVFVPGVQANRVNIDTDQTFRFTSTRGGAGVGVGFDTVSSAEHRNVWNGPNQRNHQRDPFTDPILKRGGHRGGSDNLEAAVRPFSWMDGRGPDNWLTWRPDVSVSREQRVTVEAKNTSGAGLVTPSFLWGVFVYEIVAQHD